MNTKVCTACKEPKELSDFYWSNREKGLRHSKCRTCRRGQFKTWSTTASGRRVKRDGILRREYRVTEEQYKEMYARQGGVCAICMQAETKRHHKSGTTNRLCIDHDHETGEVRALLCSLCNNALGCFKDNCNVMLAAIGYIQYFKSIPPTGALPHSSAPDLVTGT